MKKIIGYTRQSYPEKRIFLDLPFENIEFKRKYDLYTIKRKINQKLKFHDWNTQNTHKPIPYSDTEIAGYHFFNTISYSNKPYITTFETSIPRWKSKVIKGLKLLEKNNCRALVAISERAYGFQKNIINNYDVNRDILLTKLIKIPPAQKLYKTPKDIIRNKSEHLNLIFIGNQFFLKGGYELLLACEELINLNFPISLKIVSTIETDNWFTKSTNSMVEKVKSIIYKYPQHFLLYSNINNEEVLDLISKSDICFLPSLAETYGYSLLEAMAFGCPIVTTNVGAFEELNNQSRGWIIPISKNSLGQAVINNRNSNKPFSEELLFGLKNTIIKIFDDNDKSSLYKRSLNSLEYINLYHNPEKIAKKYSCLYAKF